MSNPKNVKTAMQKQRDEQIAQAEKRREEAQVRIDAARNNK